MKNTKNFIVVGATLLFSAISTGGFAQTQEPPLPFDADTTEYLSPDEEPSIDPPLPPPDLNKVKMDMNNLRQQWDSLYQKMDANILGEMYTDLVLVRKSDDSIVVKTRKQIINLLDKTITSLNNKFKETSYSSQQTDVKLESDGTIRVIGTYTWKHRDGSANSGTYDRNVIFVGGKYKICKHNEKQLFASLRTCDYVQPPQQLISLGDQPILDPVEPSELRLAMDTLLNEWGDLYAANDVDKLAKTYADVVYLRKPDGDIIAKTRGQMKNSFFPHNGNMKFRGANFCFTDSIRLGNIGLIEPSRDSDCSIWLSGRFWICKEGPLVYLIISGTFDRNVRYVDGRYKIFKQADVVLKKKFYKKRPGNQNKN